MPAKALFLHLLRIVFAYLAASIAAGIVLAYLFSGFGPQGFETVIGHHIAAIMGGTMLIGPLIVVYAAIPALGFVALAEFLHITAGIYYAGLAALASALMAYFFLPGLANIDVASYGVAGAIAGLVYWVAAGRHAGLRRARAP